MRRFKSLVIRKLSGKSNDIWRTRRTLSKASSKIVKNRHEQEEQEARENDN
jgi:hypothetical protein